MKQTLMQALPIGKPVCCQVDACRHGMVWHVQIIPCCRPDRQATDCHACLIPVWATTLSSLLPCISTALPSTAPAAMRTDPQLECLEMDLGAGSHHEHEQEVLKNYTPRASVVPAELDLTACPFMWPFCRQPLYAHAMPTMVNATVLNGMGLTGAPSCPSSPIQSLSFPERKTQVRQPDNIQCCP